MFLIPYGLSQLYLRKVRARVWGLRSYVCFYFRLRNSELKRERQRDFRLVRFPRYDSDYTRYNPGDWLKFSPEKVRLPS